MTRRISHAYRDPLDELWLATARRLGFEVRRSAEVYAHSDGARVLHLSDPAHFDADDSLAQLILHELCHALIEGPASWHSPDWGLDNVSARDEPREHAALRLQAALLDRVGLRLVLAPTTDFRDYYDRLGPEPLVGDEAAARAAREGWTRSQSAPFDAALSEALEATRRVVEAVAPFAAPDSVLGRLERAPAANPAPRESE